MKLITWSSPCTYTAHTSHCRRHMLMHCACRHLDIYKRYYMCTFSYCRSMLACDCDDWPFSCSTVLYSSEWWESYGKVEQRCIGLATRRAQAKGNSENSQQVGSWMEQKHRQWRVSQAMLSRWENSFISYLERETKTSRSSAICYDDVTMACGLTSWRRKLESLRRHQVYIYVWICGGSENCAEYILHCLCLQLLHLYRDWPSTHSCSWCSSR